MPRHQVGQLADQLGVLPGRRGGPRATPRSRPAAAPPAAAAGRGPRFGVELGQRRPLPQPQRLRRTSSAAAVPPGAAARLLDQLGEPVHIDRVRVDLEQVARAPGHHQRLGQADRPQRLRSRDTRPCSALSALCGQVLAPQAVDQVLGGHHPARVEQQQRQQRPLRRPAQHDRGAVDDDLQRPEQAELHADLPRPGRPILLPLVRTAATSRRSARSTVCQRLNSTSQVARAIVGSSDDERERGPTMATIRVHCPHCPTTALLRPEQVLLVSYRGGGSYLFFCPACGRVTDGPAGPEPSPAAGRRRRAARRRAPAGPRGAVMIIPESFLWTWFALAALSTAYVAWDNFVAGNPEETVMKWGWVLITVYMGPIAAALYVLTDKEPRPGEHEALHPAAVEAGHRLHRALHRRRRHRHRRRRRDHLRARSADVGRSRSSSTSPASASACSSSRPCS